MLKMLNNLSVRGRMLLSVSVLVAVLLVALAQLYLTIQSNIDFAVMEKKGNQMIRPLAGVMSDLVDMRILLEMGREGRAITDPLAAIVTSINKKMDAVSEAYGAVGADLQFTDEGLASRGREALAMDKIAEKWKRLSASAQSAPSEDHDADMASLIADIRGMIGHAGDTSNLVLDPDLDSYYLMDVTLLVMPQTFDRMSLIGSELYRWETSTLSETEKVETAVMSRLLSESDIDRAVADMDTSLKEDVNFYTKSPSYERNIAGPFGDYREASHKLADMMKSLAGGEVVSRDDFVRVVQTAKESAYVFWDVGLNELDSLLDIRIAAFKKQQMEVLVVSLLGLFIGLACYAMVIYSLTKPLSALIGSMDKLAKNDINVDIAYGDAHSEIGAMARAIAVFKENALEADRLRQQRVESEENNRVQRQQTLNAIADDFQSEVGGVVGVVATAARHMNNTATGLMQLVSEVSAKATTVATASAEASVNVQAVSGATEQLSASIQEISQQVSHSSAIANQAKVRAEDSNRQVKGLVAAAEKIGVVVNLISDIAEQTNLLALNATIEAARAGDAGKGFAVVASEVKALANQTANATGQIGTQIKAIQDATVSAAQAIAEITATIDRINDITASVAAAVEQQGAATSDIARNVQQAAMGTQQVAANIGDVTCSVQEAGTSSGEMLSASQNLADQSNKLQQAMAQFLSTVRKQA